MSSIRTEEGLSSFRWRALQGKRIRQKTAAEVKEMADGCLCSEVEEKYGRKRHQKWGTCYSRRSQIMLMRST